MTDSCSSRAVDSSSVPVNSNSNSNNAGGGNRHQQNRHKYNVFIEVLRRLKESGRPDAQSPTFDDDLWAHFNRLPTTYAMDLIVERAEDVLTHKSLLELAHDPAYRPTFAVRLVQLPPLHDGNQGDSVDKTQRDDEAHCSSNYLRKQSIHPSPVFGSSPNLESLALEASKQHVQDGGSAADASPHFSGPVHEITFSTSSSPKLLSELTYLLGDIGVNIQEAHVFSTIDDYWLGIFVVDGWYCEETKGLRIALQRALVRTEKQAWLKPHPLSPKLENAEAAWGPLPEHVQIPTDGNDVWEIDFRLLKIENEVASGSYGDLYRGAYRSQEVAIKMLKPEAVNVAMQREFAEEVYIMRKVRHQNVVQFIGACTRPPSLCIVTEFMSGGSVYDFLHKQNGVFKLPALLRVAIDVSKGMNYLHQNNIIHRDLKASNLLMDENEVVKVADFCIARVKAQTGVMNAETATYRWMAPEAIEHKPYDHKADVFSFGIVSWELLTGKVPYEYLTPLQAAVGVVQKGVRPIIPKDTHPRLVELLEKCWKHDPAERPDFSDILQILQHIAEEVGDETGEMPQG